MDPTRHTIPPDERPGHRADVSSPVVPPNSRNNSRQTGRRRALSTSRRAIRPRASSVWLCGQDDVVAGTGMLASWLLSAIIKLVTTYTKPGRRVLLLDCVSCAPAAAAGARNTIPTRLGRSLYSGLHEAGWTVVRLGRGVQTHTAFPVFDDHDAPSTDDRAKSGSGPRRSAEGPGAGRAVGPRGPGSRRPDSTRTDDGPFGYDLIITAVEPWAFDTLDIAGWAGLLRREGVFAAITHGESHEGRYTDPAAALVAATERKGLRYLDRIVLLRVPVHTSALASTGDGFGASAGSQAGAAGHTRVHEDLLLFVRDSDTPVAEETSDD